MPSFPAPDLARCATEPIRTPGAIQPHGWMVTLDAAGGLPVACSDNWDSQLVGVPSGQMQPAIAALVRGLDGRLDDLVEGEAPRSCGVMDVQTRRLHVSAHRLGPWVHLEFEADAQDSGAQAPIYSIGRHLLPKLQQTDTVARLCAVAASEMKRLSGFGRCLVYRFDEEGHGQVVAEVADEGYERYANHRFPASDIPPQARELYRLNHLRLIPDAHYLPVPLSFFDARQQASAVLDLSQASLRSVSPVHLEYMRNMGTRASMSVSIIVRGALWGLVSCHDHDARHLPYQVRSACEHLGQLLSLQIEAKEEHQHISEQLKLRQLTLSMVADLADSDATLQHLVDHPAPLLRLGRATGAAVLFNDAVWSIGDVPGEVAMAALSQWLSGRIEHEIHTDRIASLLPALGQDVGRAAGVMAISISRLHRHYIVWFRPELVQTIEWAGDPRAHASASEDGRLHPRRSFATWRELVEGRSAPWSTAEVLAALELRQALIGIVLRRAQEMAEVATELGRVNKELEAFSYTVSHDLRAPMRHISGFVDLVLELEGEQLSERSRTYLGHVKEASSHAGVLVDALLDFSRMGRTSLKESVIDSHELVQGLIAEFDQQEPGRRIEWTVEGPLPRLWADPILLQVAMRNLMSNAVKYTRPRDPAKIRISALAGEGAAGLEVGDNGVGFQMKYASKLFGVFQRLHSTEEFDGTGIGLASVRRIIERHGGSVTAWGEPGQGARFGFTIPNRADASDPA